MKHESQEKDEWVGWLIWGSLSLVFVAAFVSTVSGLPVETSLMRILGLLAGPVAIIVLIALVIFLCSFIARLYEKWQERRTAQWLERNLKSEKVPLEPLKANRDSENHQQTLAKMGDSMVKTFNTLSLGQAIAKLIAESMETVAIDREVLGHKIVSDLGFFLKSQDNRPRQEISNKDIEQGLERNRQRSKEFCEGMAVAMIKYVGNKDNNYD